MKGYGKKKYYVQKDWWKNMLCKIKIQSQKIPKKLATFKIH